MSDNQDKKQRWYFTVYNYEFPDEMHRLQSGYADLSAYLSLKDGLSPAQVHSEIWKAGVKALLEEHEIVTEDELLREARQAIKENEKRQSRLFVLRKAKSAMGTEAFQELCEKFGENPDDVNELPFENRSDRDFEFLRSILADGKPLSTTQIKDEAVLAGIIAPATADGGTSWDRLRSVASRQGFTKHSHGNGFWALPYNLRTNGKL